MNTRHELETLCGRALSRRLARSGTYLDQQTREDIIHDSVVEVLARLDSFLEAFERRNGCSPQNWDELGGLIWIVTRSCLGNYQRRVFTITPKISPSLDDQWRLCRASWPLPARTDLTPAMHPHGGITAAPPLESLADEREQPLDRVDLLDIWLEVLPNDKLREALLWLAKGLPIAETARLMQISRNTLKARREAIRLRFDSLGITPETVTTRQPSEEN